MADVKALAKLLKKTMVPAAIKHFKGVNDEVRQIAVDHLTRTGVSTDGLEAALEILFDGMKDAQKLTPQELKKVAKQRVYQHRDALRSLPNGHPDNAWRSPEQLALHVWCELSLDYPAVPHDAVLRWVKHAWLTWAEEQKSLPQEDLAYDGVSTLDEVIADMTTAWSGAFRHRSEAELNRHVRAVLCWMWGVKRRNAGMSNPWPFVLTFMGRKNGTGKSTFVQNLIDPWGFLVESKTVPQIVDERHQSAIAQKAVIFLDELAGASKADFNAFKRLITAPYLNVRQLYSSEPGEYQMYASFIATSNNENVSEFWQDSSGIRRWYPLLVDSFHNEVDEHWASADLWRRVNPEWSQFFGEADTKEIEGEHRRQDTLEEFSQFTGIVQGCPDVVEDGQEAIFVSSSTLYSHYKQFVARAANLLTMRLFAQKFQSGGFGTPHRWKRNGRSVRGWRIVVEFSHLPDEADPC